MAAHVNPGNGDFAKVLEGCYVDKTGLIGLVNDVINTAGCMVSVSRPRRFGKSFAAKSLVAYYCCGCDSHALFDGRAVSQHPTYEDNINRYNVVLLDMTEFTGSVGADVVPAVSKTLVTELRQQVGDAGSAYVGDPLELTATLLDFVEATGRPFVFVIDEWDAVFREAKGDVVAQERYVRFLRLLFKNASFTGKAVAAAYLTGILPIKRYGTQSALTDFNEYSMVQPSDYAPYVGFVEGEVEGLSRDFGLTMSELRRWYDGYDLPGASHVFAPYSVMQACQRGRVGHYWTRSETYRSLLTYIEMDFDGLQQAITSMLGGSSVEVNTLTFQNDVTSVKSRDDVLTLLIHLGYLAYDEGLGTVRIPNEEVRSEFLMAVGQSAHPYLVEAIRQSRELLAAIIEGDEATVASGIQKVHDGNTTPLFYNGEQALRSVVKTALFAAIDDYACVEELPSGRGFADLVYVPRKGGDLPALLVELKWDKPVDAAMAQIERNDYPAALRGLGMPVVAVGVTYDPKTKAHDCRILQLDVPFAIPGGPALA